MGEVGAKQYGRLTSRVVQQVTNRRTIPVAKSSPCLDPDNEGARGVVIACSLAVTVRYVFWRLFYTLPQPGFSFEWAIGVVFAAAEGLTFLSTSITLVLLSRTCSRSEEVERRRG